MSDNELKTWESYEEVATYLLNSISIEFGLERVEGKQALLGKSGTTWTIDAKGVRVGDEGFVVVEYRRYTTSRLKQENLAAVAYRIRDLGGTGGITVSPLPLQEGARKVAEYEKIIHVELTPHSTKENYILKFLNKLFVGQAETVSVSERYDFQIIRNGKIVKDFEK